MAVPNEARGDAKRVQKKKSIVKEHTEYYTVGDDDGSASVTG